MILHRMKPATFVATAYSFGHWPEVTGVPLLVPFFPSFIAAAGGDEGRKKRELGVRRLEPHADAADAWGYMLSLLRSWFSGCFTQSIESRYIFAKAQLQNSRAELPKLAAGHDLHLGQRARKHNRSPQ